MGEFTIGEAFANSTSTWSSVSVFMTALIWLVGAILAGFAIVDFKAVADGKVAISRPIWLTVISALMIAVSSFVPILSETLVNGGEYKPQSLFSQIPKGRMLPGVAEALTSVLLFVQALGTIAIFRSFLMFQSAAKGKREDLPRAFTHLIGGVLAVNIQLTISIIASTFYPNFDLSLIGV
ncbi:hypothetical protein REJ26_004349 [Providencia stuartii]|uniref:hypothetical protein n=1 Tax=Providencia sp. 2023EL-00965 TaxID=3084975 RepID=UPI0027EAB6E6|nr:hypothetical protein [Providencia sp. 2023EL-00965]ELR5302487.1 hypothetical protein [Providencia stuartii]MDW7590949.1 hypothetical protein [Providencia sp. 2023EL-00965]